MVIIEDLKNFKKKFQNKVRDYKRSDQYKKEHFPIENENLHTLTMTEAIQLVNDLESDLCTGCGCKILFCNYQPYCIYQFSFDRIDNNKIHSVENVKIVCWNCNSMGYGAHKNSCSKGCHISEKRVRNELACIHRP